MSNLSVPMSEMSSARDLLVANFLYLAELEDNSPAP